MKTINVIVLSIMFELLVTGCQPVKSNKQYFDEYFKINVSACASVFVKQNKIDSIAAVNYCSCLLNKLYLIDSNSVKMKGKELNELINRNKDIIDIECDSLLSK